MDHSLVWQRDLQISLYIYHKCNKNRNKVLNKCDVLKPSPDPGLAKACLPRNPSLVPKKAGDHRGRSPALY